MVLAFTLLVICHVLFIRTGGDSVLSSKVCKTEGVNTRIGFKETKETWKGDGSWKLCSLAGWNSSMSQVFG